MFIKVMIITAIVYLMGWLLYRKYDLNLTDADSSDVHRWKYDPILQAIILILICLCFTCGFLMYQFYAQNREDNFLVSSGLLFSVLLAVLGLIINKLYNYIVKAFNRRLKNKYNDDNMRYIPQTPMSILFDMGIILIGEIAYLQSNYVLIGICTSYIVGEYLGIDSLINRTSKKKSLFSKIKKVPFSLSFIFIMLVVMVWIGITIESYIACVIGYYIGVIFTAPIELKRYKKGLQNEYFGKKGSGSNESLNQVKQDVVSENRTVQIIRSEKEISIIKNNDVFLPKHNISQIVEFINAQGVFKASKRWYVPGMKIFDEKCAKAIGAYACAVQKEDVILINDSTVSGSSKRGFLLTSTKLYHRDPYEPDFSCNIEHINHIYSKKKPYSPGLYSVIIAVDGVEREIVSLSKAELPVIINKLYEIVAFIYGYEDYTKEVVK